MYLKLGILAFAGFGAGAVIAAGDLGVDCGFADSILYPVGD